MAQASKIEWTDVTWNPVHGCSKVSTGCKNCYAETLSLRYGQTTVPWTARNAEQNVMLKPHKLREPLSKAGAWKQPCMVFVNSMSDLFHEQIPDEYIARVFGVMANAPQHTFQILTKRPERMSALLRSWTFCKLVGEQISAVVAPKPANGWAYMAWHDDGYLDNIWLGVSIENRKWVARADVLREVPAAVRFISAEPLLGPLIVTRQPHWPTDYDPGPELDLAGIDWLIAGGESGPGHRPLDLAWVRDLRDACQHAGTAFFVKQLGGMRPGTKLADLPADLRIREMPVSGRQAA